MAKIMAVNGNVYEVTDKVINNMMNLVKDACKKRKLHMIYSLQKANKYDMVQLKYPTAEEMETEVKKFREQGFKVHRASFGE